jgi:hypothetical protein
MSAMKEKPVPTKHATPPRGEATREMESERTRSRGNKARRRVRKIVERHRETFDQLAK